jgi:phosphatidylglycerophosphatase A
MTAVRDGALAPPTISDRLALLLATYLGTGYAPIASGTVATAAAIPLQLAVALLPPPGMRLWAQVAAILFFSLGGIAAATVAERRLGSHDPSQVVVDEVAGYLITMFLVPPTWITVTAGFLLFRAFDIVKPWPAGPAERLGGGLGIMADDLICGVYASLILHAALWLLPGLS